MDGRYEFQMQIRLHFARKDTAVKPLVTLLRALDVAYRCDL